MSSKSVTDRSKSVELVTHALRASAVSASTQITGRLKPYLKSGESMPDLALLFELLARGVESHGAAMRKADEAHAAELSDDAEPRSRRDQAHDRTHDAVVEIKEAVGSLFGELWLGKLQLPNPIPQDPVVLERAASDFLGALERTKLPAPKLKGVGAFDASHWKTMLEEPVKTLRASLGDVARETREAEVTLKEKSRAVAAHDAFFSLAAGLGVSLLRLAGEDELAARLRPSGRRPGMVASDEDTTEPTPSPAPSP